MALPAVDLARLPALELLSCLEAIVATLGLVTFLGRGFGFVLGIVCHLPSYPHLLYPQARQTRQPSW